MKTEELESVWLYLRAVSRQWWVVIVEGLLLVTDLAERIFGTWLLPSTRVKLGIGLAALTVAQYRAYREILRQLRSEREKKTELVIFPDGRSFLYIETPVGAGNPAGFYLEFRLGIQNNGPQNSVIRKFDLEIQETGARLEGLAPSRRSHVQTRRGQHMMQSNWISEQPSSVVVPAHNVCSGILAFYVPGDLRNLPGIIHCKLKIEDTTKTSGVYTFDVTVIE